MINFPLLVTTIVFFSVFNRAAMGRARFIMPDFGVNLSRFERKLQKRIQKK